MGSGATADTNRLLCVAGVAKLACRPGSISPPPSRESVCTTPKPPCVLSASRSRTRSFARGLLCQKWRQRHHRVEWHHREQQQIRRRLLRHERPLHINKIPFFLGSRKAHIMLDSVSTVTTCASAFVLPSLDVCHLLNGTVFSVALALPPYPPPFSRIVLSFFAAIALLF